MTQDSEAAEKTRKLHLSNEAKRILAEPLLENFFEQQELICLEALKRLPLGTKLDEYQTLHHTLLANERLKLTLHSYIEDSDMMILQESRDEKVAEGI